MAVDVGAQPLGLLLPALPVIQLLALDFVPESG
jgi:hypothetical protein